MPRKSTYHRSIMCPDACCDEHSHIFCQVDTVCWASVHCMRTFRGPILWGHDVCSTDQSMDQSDGSCTKDQSNGNMLYGDTIHKRI